MPNKTHKQLRAEVEKLRREERGKRIILERAKKDLIARVKLEKEIKELKNPKSKEFKQNLRRGLRSAGRGVGKGLLRGGKLALQAALLIGEDVDKKAKAIIESKRKRRELEILKLKERARKATARKRK